MRLLVRRLIAAVAFCWLSASAGAVANNIVVAVVDDGFNSHHHIFDGMRWRNQLETPNNRTDDDENGYIDDLTGWDAADEDNDISPPPTRLSEYAHGTFMAGVIALEIKKHLGDRAEYPIKLMFVKALSDYAGDTAIKQGYQGLQYAITAGADVVNLSWSGGTIDQRAAAALKAAETNRIFVVASMGNHPQAMPIFPASHPAVFGVSGVNDRGQLAQSNFGDEADLSAIATSTQSASVLDDHGLMADQGVSVATARVSAAVALMKLANRQASNLQIKACLQSTATPIDASNPDLPGQLGAGKLNTEAAIDCITSPVVTHAIALQQPEGTLQLANSGRNKKISKQWLIEPSGKYDGVTLEPFVEGDPGDATLTVSTIDEPASTIWHGKLTDLPARIRLGHPQVKVEIDAQRARNFSFTSHYKTKLRDLSRQFCDGRTVITEAQQIEDGSGEQLYANRSDCEWLLKAPDGHQIAITFSHLDTELHTDYVHLFHGDNREQRNLLMRLSGSKPPPKIVIKKPTALLWFVTNEMVIAHGFSANVMFEPISSATNAN